MQGARSVLARATDRGWKYSLLAAPEAGTQFPPRSIFMTNDTNILESDLEEHCAGSEASDGWHHARRALEFPQQTMGPKMASAVESSYLGQCNEYKWSGNWK